MGKQKEQRYQRLKRVHNVLLKTYIAAIRSGEANEWGITSDEGNKWDITSDEGDGWLTMHHLADLADIKYQTLYSLLDHRDAWGIVERYKRYAPSGNFMQMVSIHKEALARELIRLGTILDLSAPF